MGADRIARTACATLRELDSLRDRICRAIPLAWHKECLEGVHAIEVYPAATLRSHGLTCAGYKKEGDSEHRRLREGIADGLPNVEIPNRMRETTLDNADGLDAVVCVQAAADFVGGTAGPPPDADVAHALREGWIWCHDESRQHLRPSAE